MGFGFYYTTSCLLNKHTVKHNLSRWRFCCSRTHMHTHINALLIRPAMVSQCKNVPMAHIEANKIPCYFYFIRNARINISCQISFSLWFSIYLLFAFFYYFGSFVYPIGFTALLFLSLHIVIDLKWRFH